MKRTILRIADSPMGLAAIILGATYGGIIVIAAMMLLVVSLLKGAGL